MHFLLEAALWNMGLALDQLGKRREAIKHAEYSLMIHEQIEDPYAVNIRAQLAKCARRQDTISLWT